VCSVAAFVCMSAFGCGIWLDCACSAFDTSFKYVCVWLCVSRLVRDRGCWRHWSLWVGLCACVWSCVSRLVTDRGCWRHWSLWVGLCACVWSCVSHLVTDRDCWRHWSLWVRLARRTCTNSCWRKCEPVASCLWRRPRRCCKWLMHAHSQRQTKKFIFALWSVVSVWSQWIYHDLTCIFARN